LALATNAPLSDTALVRQPLQRLGLDGFFEAVFTARELGVSKPDPSFFRVALRDLGCAPGQAVMIGDGYENDVIGAKEAGLREVWFNPGASPGPLVHPLHDGEVRELAELPAAVETRGLPDVLECLALLAEQDVPSCAVRH
jgi:FMN phosphatase YigB (HAD superfamily)